MALIIKKPWLKQPDRAVVVDWTNPITQGLVFARLGGTQTSVWPGNKFTRTGTKVRGSQFGLADGFGSTLGVGTTDVIDTGYNVGTTRKTYFFRFFINGNGAGGNARLFERGSNTELAYIPGGAGNNNVTYGQAFTTAQGQWVTPTNSIIAGNTYTVVITYDGSSVSNNPIIYINGVAVTVTTALTPAGTISTTTSNYLIGNRTDGTRNFDGLIAETYIWNRILTPVEIGLLTNNPYQLFRPLELQLNSPPAPRLYYVIGPASGWTDPTPLQIKNGQLAGGGAATASGNESAPLTDAVYTFINAATGLTASTNYKLAFVEYDGDLYSNVVVASFTTTGGTTYNESLTESSAIAETQTAATTYVVSTSETAAIAETQTAATTYAVSTSETAATSTTETAATTYPVSVSESAAIAETQAGILVFPVSVSESAAISETQSVATTYAPSLTESASVTATEAATTDYTVSRTESAATATTEDGVVTSGTTVSENATITDTQTGAVTYAVSISESAAITDAQTVGSAFSVSLTESAAIADTQTVATNYSVSRSETAATATTETVATSYAPSVSETVAIADTNSAATAYIVSALETAAFAEQAVAALIYNVTRTETAALTDSMIGYKNGWADIDDTQTANWQNVSTVQSANWQTIDTAQTPGWTIIPTQ